MKRLAIALLVSVASTTAFAKSSSPELIVFGGGSAQVLLPSGVETTSTSEHLLARFGPKKDHILEISFNPSPAPSVDGRDFVMAAAAKKSAQVKSGVDRVLFIDPAGDVEMDGSTFRVVHWQIGVKEGVFVLTLTAPLPMSAEFGEFLGEDLVTLVNSVAAAGSN